jgi:hypothetical protein
VVTENYFLLGCDVMQSDRSLLMFQRNVMPPSSGYKNDSSLPP